MVETFKTLVSFAVALLLLANGAMAIPDIPCMTSSQEATLDGIAQAANVSAPILKSAFVLMCTNEDNTNTNEGNINDNYNRIQELESQINNRFTNHYTKNETYTRGEIDILTDAINSNIEDFYTKGEFDILVNLTRTELLNELENINDTLTERTEKQISSRIEEIKDDLEILDALEEMGSLVKASLDTKENDEKITRIEERIDSLEEQIRDARNQLNIGPAQNTNNQQANQQNTQQTGQQNTQQYQQLLQDYTTIILFVIIVGILGAYFFRNKFTGIKTESTQKFNSYKRGIEREKRSPVRESHISQSDWDEDTDTAWDDLIEENDKKAREASRIKKEKTRNIKSTADKLKNQQQKNRKKSEL